MRRMWAPAFAGVVAIAAVALFGCGNDEATDTATVGATEEEEVLELVREYLHAIRDQDWAAVCETRTEAEQKQFAESLGSCASVAKALFASPQAQRLGEEAAELGPESVEITGNSAVLTSPAGRFHARRESDGWKLYDPGRLDLVNEEPTQSFQRAIDRAPACQTEQPKPFRAPGSALRLERPEGSLAGQAATLEIAIAGQGAEIDAWQVVQGTHRVIGLVFAAPGVGGGQDLRGFVRGIEQSGGDAQMTSIAGRRAALGSSAPGSVSAATTSGCYGAFAFGRDEETVRFLLERLVRYGGG